MCKKNGCISFVAAKERMTLTDHFLADGIDEVAFVFDFLPDCVANAPWPKQREGGGGDYDPENVNDLCEGHDL